VWLPPFSEWVKPLVGATSSHAHVERVSAVSTWSAPDRRHGPRPIDDIVPIRLRGTHRGLWRRRGAIVFLVFAWHDGSMDGSDLIRTGEAAAILGSSRQHVVDLCNLGLLSYERSPTQRRLRRSEVETLAARLGAGTRLNRDQRQSLWLHVAVAGHLAVDPTGTLEHARTNLGRLRRAHPSGMSSRWLEAWQAVLGGGPDAVLQTLTSRAPMAIELRQNSPFAGVLKDDERRAVLRAFRDHDRVELG